MNKMKIIINLMSFLCLLMLGISPVMSQTKTLKGRILDDNREPLIGVNVIIKGDTKGTVSDYNGRFEIEVPSETNILVFSYTGFETQEIPIDGQLTLNVYMKESSLALSEVTVTGFSGIKARSRRRLESIQEIPEAVIAFDDEQIEMTGVDDIGSFLTQVPGISYGESQDPGTVLINVRGIPQIRYGHSPIALVVDGVYLADANLNVQSLFDIEQIEVVKGSQGIFYGKNAIGGAVNITTKAITNDFKGNVKVGQGNGNSSVGNFAISGPLKKDKIYFRLAGNYFNTDGLIENTFLNEFTDFKTEQGVRGTLKFELNESTDLTLTGQRSYSRGGAITFISSNHNDDFTGIFETPLPSDIDGDINSPNNYSGSPRADYLGSGTIDTYFASINFEKNFRSFRLSSVTSFTDVDLFYDGDYFSYGPVPDAAQNMIRGSETFNQEFRLVSISNSKLQWNTGVFFQHINSPWITNQVNNNLSDPLVSEDFEYKNTTEVALTDDENKLTSFAPFAFLEYSITNELKVSAGARNEFEQIENTTKLAGSSNSRSYSVFQPKVSASYNVTKKVMIYGSYSGGFRSGGYNAAAIESGDNGGGIEKEIRHETSESIEAGLKSSFVSDRVIFNFAWFNTIYNDQQAYRFGYGNVDGDPSTGDASGNESFLGTVNLKETKLTGFEIDVKLRPFKFLDIIGGYSAIDSEITEAGVIGGFDEKANNGNKTPFTLESSWNIGLLSRIPVSNNAKIRANLNFENKGKKYWFAENYLLPQENVFQDPYTLIHARLMVDFKNMTFGVWGRNLADTKYNIEWWPLSGFGLGDIRVPNQPRTYGFDIAYRF